MTEKTPSRFTAQSIEKVDDVRHGFFSREGGVSGGVYASLNTGYGSDDSRGNIDENRRRIRQALADDAPPLNTVYQVHGRTVAHATQAWAPSDAPKADAMVTDRPGIALGVQHADCCPVLFADAEGRAVGAAHAGWRGALGGVLEATLDAMEALGANRQAISAAIGPTIGPDSYEVGPEFPAPFIDEDAASARCFRPAPREGHFLFDLPGYVAARLARAGVAEIEDLKQDTCADERFFSYRRMTHRGEPDYGRALSAILLMR